MDLIAAHHLNAFNIQHFEDESVSSQSNMSGTFNQLNNSLKITQRKQKKASNTQSDKESVMSEDHSLKSFKQDQKHAMDSKEIQNANHQAKGKLPPPPKLVQAMTKHFQTAIGKSMPPPMVNISEKGQSAAHQVTDKGNNLSSVSLHSKLKGGILSPPGKKEDNEKVKMTVSIKEDIQDIGKGIKKDEQDRSISQDQIPQQDEDEPFIIKINVKNHSNIPANVKIPNPNYNILEQAKFLLMSEVSNHQEGDFQLTEELLSRTIKQIHNHLMKQKEVEYERSLSDYNKQVMSFQAQVQILTTNQSKQSSTPFAKKQTSQALNLETQGTFGITSTLNESANQQQLELQQSESFKKLKEENQELRMKSQFLEQDLQYQAQKTKDLQTKYENEIENLRSQLKGSQSEQFVKQQIEHKKLIEDNAVLMREVKTLQDQLCEEQQRVIDLFEDAQQVRDEILKEMTEFEKTKGQLEKMKAMNKNLKKKLHDHSLDFSEYNDMEDASGNDDQDYSNNDQSLGEDENELRKSRKKKIQQISVALSRPESLLSLANGFNQRLEEVIEEKSKSIINVLTKSHTNQFAHYQHPYALNYQYPHPYQQQNYVIQNDHMSHANRMRPNQVSARNIVEMSLYESENGGVYQNSSNSNLENYRSPDTSSQYNRILQTNGSDLQILKHKIKEVRDKHNTQLNDYPFQHFNQASQKSLNDNQPPINLENTANFSLPQQNILQTQASHADTFKAMNSGMIKQEAQPLSVYYREDAERNDINQQYKESAMDEGFMSGHEHRDYDEANLQSQFKTPVWTGQFHQDEDDEEEQNQENQRMGDHQRKQRHQRQKSNNRTHHSLRQTNMAYSP